MEELLLRAAAYDQKGNSMKSHGMPPVVVRLAGIEPATHGLKIRCASCYATVA